MCECEQCAWRSDDNLGCQCQSLPCTFLQTVSYPQILLRPLPISHLRVWNDQLSMKPSNPQAQNPACSSSGIEIWPIPTLKIFSLEELHTLEVLYKPCAYSVGSCPFPPWQRGSHSPRFLPPNISLETVWVKNFFCQSKAESFMPNIWLYSGHLEFSKC